MFGDRRQSDLDQSQFLVRLLLLCLVAVFAIALLLLRTSYLTLVRGDELYELSEKSYVGREKIEAPRGDIVDRKGRVLARSEERFRLYISRLEFDREQIAKTLEATVRLCPRIDPPAAEDVMALRPAWKRLAVADDLTLAEATPLMERLAMLHGLQIEQTFVRVYPQGRVASHLTGYIRAMSPKQIDKRLEQGYDRTDLIGVKGLEYRFEGDLKGRKGKEFVYRDAHRRLRYSEVSEGEETVEGNRLVLTIDLDIQNLAAGLLRDRPGVIVVMDPRNGAILAMASNPDFDPNFPGQASLEGNSSFNKAIVGNYPPGSIFKIVTATAALTGGSVYPSREISCGGAFSLGEKNKIRCDAKWGHGLVNLKQALAGSCNVYFCTLASELDLSHLVAVAGEFGLGQSTGICLGGRGDRGGLGPRDPTARPYRGDRVQMGIGQGSLISVTPLQMAVAYSTLANGGTRYNARVVHAIEAPDAPVRTFASQPLSEVSWTPSQRKAVLDGVRAVVESSSGTGRHGQFDPAWKVAGKTGTAEAAIGKEPHAWFVGFSPWDAAEVCVVVLFEHAGHGGEVAAPVARDVLEEYYRLYPMGTRQAE